MPQIILRLPSVLRQRRRSWSTPYSDIQSGPYMRTVANGERAEAWPEYEVAAVNAAQSAGRSTYEIRALQRQLEATRLSIPDEIARSFPDPAGFWPEPLFSVQVSKGFPLGGLCPASVPAHRPLSKGGRWDGRERDAYLVRSGKDGIGQSPPRAPSLLGRCQVNFLAPSQRG